MIALTDRFKRQLDDLYTQAIFKESTVLQQAAIAVPQSEWKNVAIGSIVRIVRKGGVTVIGPKVDRNWSEHIAIGTPTDPHYVAYDKIQSLFIETPAPAPDPQKAVIEAFAKALYETYNTGWISNNWPGLSEATRGRWKQEAQRFLGAIDAQRAEEAA